MTRFPFEHLEGCVPHDACACCEAIALLKSGLSPSLYDRFLKIAHRAYGENAENTAEITLDSLWEPIMGDKLSVRTRNCLWNEGTTFRDIVKQTEAELLRIPNFGLSSLNEIKKVLGSFGFELGSS